MVNSNCHVSCPACGERFPVVAGLNDADARRFAYLMGEIPSNLAPNFLRYLHFFREEGRSLSWETALREGNRLLPYIKQQQVFHNGSRHPAPIALWKSGIEVVLSRKSKLKLPLTSHSYLSTIVASLSEEWQAKQEEERESQRRAGKTAEREFTREEGEWFAKLKSTERLNDHAPHPKLQAEIHDLKEKLSAKRKERKVDPWKKET